MKARFDEKGFKLNRKKSENGCDIFRLCKGQVNY